MPGTGFAGRVTRDDVLAYVAANGNGSALVLPAALAAPAAAGCRSRHTERTRGGRRHARDPGADYLKPLSQMRRGIAAQMTRASAVPTAYETVEVDMSSVVRLRDKHKRSYQEREGIGLSFVAFVTKAAVEGAAPAARPQQPLDRRGPLGPSPPSTSASRSPSTTA